MNPNNLMPDTPPEPQREVEEKNTAIITALDGGCAENLLLDFLPTLRGVAAYAGQVHILDYGLSDSQRAQAEEYDVKIWPQEKGTHIVVQRFGDAAKLIESFPSPITHLMMIDCGDVWFQRPFGEVWSLTAAGVGFVEEDHVDRSVSMQRWLGQLKPELHQRFRTALAGKRTINMGMVVGAREHIRWLFNETYQQSLQMGKNAFGVDQIVANYLLRSKSGQCELTPLAADYNYIVLAYLDSLRVEGPLILDGIGEAPPIIHNLGGTSRPIKGPWLKVRQDHRLYTSFEIERICRCWMRQGPNRNLLLAAMKAWGRAPAVATCQMLRQLALGVLPKSWVQFIVTLKKKGKG